jgi:hypothetical protein
MNKYLVKFKIQITVAIFSILIIVFYPIVRAGGSAESASSFRTAFGQLAIICFALYIGLSWLFVKVVQHFQLPGVYEYLAHLIAVILGYWLWVATFYSIAKGGIPSIF